MWMQTDFEQYMHASENKQAYEPDSYNHIGFHASHLFHI